MGRDVQILVVGTGAFGRMRVAKETEELLSEHEVTLIVLPTREAIAEYNRICQDENGVGCGLHLTC